MSHKHRHRVPDLRLHLASDAVLPPTPKSGARSAPTAADDAVPRCPKCSHRHTVHFLDGWPERQMWIWHCSYYTLGKFCGHRWVQSEPLSFCPKCKTTTRLQEQENAYGYWCSHCKTFTYYDVQ